jgi:hypothetical protein
MSKYPGEQSRVNKCHTNSQTINELTSATFCNTSLMLIESLVESCASKYCLSSPNSSIISGYMPLMAVTLNIGFINLRCLCQYSPVLYALFSKPRSRSLKFQSRTIRQEQIVIVDNSERVVHDTFTIERQRVTHVLGNIIRNQQGNGVRSTFVWSCN